jgi:L-alanine-DL-glutamate epimerase-like enolase superfamily enzyme
VRELIEQEVIDVVQPDTGRAGGILQMQKIAHLAEAHHVMVAPHSVSKRANAHTSQHAFVSCPVLSFPLLCFAFGCSTARTLPDHPPPCHSLDCAIQCLASSSIG